MTARERIDRATTRLLLSRPWWASLLLHLRVVEDATCQTAATDGVRLIYSPAFVDKLSNDELDGVLCHEVGHCAMLHMPRRGGRDPMLWNIAADAEINALLAADGITLPADCVPPGDLTETAEDIYDKMLKSGKKIKLPMVDLLEAVAAEAGMTPGQLADKWRQAVAQAAGLLPGALKRPVDDAQAPKVPWQDLLAQFISAYVPSLDRTWSRVHRRLPGMAPGRGRDPAMDVGVVIDTSGSISGNMLAAFIAECRGICGIIGARVHLIASDAAVGLIVEPGEEWPAELPGGGGTDFRPALAECERRAVDAVVYLTDGEGQYPAGCQVPVLWTLTARGAIPPFGSVVILSEV